MDGKQNKLLSDIARSLGSSCDERPMRLERSNSDHGPSQHKPGGVNLRALNRPPSRVSPHRSAGGESFTPVGAPDPLDSEISQFFYPSPFNNKRPPPRSNSSLSLSALTPHSIRNRPNTSLSYMGPSSMPRPLSALSNRSVASLRSTSTTPPQSPEGIRRTKSSPSPRVSPIKCTSSAVAELLSANPQLNDGGFAAGYFDDDTDGRISDHDTGDDSEVVGRTRRADPAQGNHSDYQEYSQRERVASPPIFMGRSSPVDRDNLEDPFGPGTPPSSPGRRELLQNKRRSHHASPAEDALPDFLNVPAEVSVESAPAKPTELKPKTPPAEKPKDIDLSEHVANVESILDKLTTEQDEKKFQDLTDKLLDATYLTLSMMDYYERCHYNNYTDPVEGFKGGTAHYNDLLKSIGHDAANTSLFIVGMVAMLTLAAASSKYADRKVAQKYYKYVRDTLSGLKNGRHAVLNVYFPVNNFVGYTHHAHGLLHATHHVMLHTLGYHLMNPIAIGVGAALAPALIYHRYASKQRSKRIDTNKERIRRLVLSDEYNIPLDENVDVNNVERSSAHHKALMMGLSVFDGLTDGPYMFGALVLLAGGFAAGTAGFSGLCAIGGGVPLLIVMAALATYTACSVITAMRKERQKQLEDDKYADELEIALTERNINELEKRSQNAPSEELNKLHRQLHELTYNFRVKYNVPPGETKSKTHLEQQVKKLECRIQLFLGTDDTAIEREEAFRKLFHLKRDYSHKLHQHSSSAYERLIHPNSAKKIEQKIDKAEKDYNAFSTDPLQTVFLELKYNYTERYALEKRLIRENLFLPKDQKFTKCITFIKLQLKLSELSHEERLYSVSKLRSLAATHRKSIYNDIYALVKQLQEIHEHENRKLSDPLYAEPSSADDMPFPVSYSDDERPLSAMSRKSFTKHLDSIENETRLCDIVSQKISCLSRSKLKREYKELAHIHERIFQTKKCEDAALLFLKIKRIQALLDSAGAPELLQLRIGQKKISIPASQFNNLSAELTRATATRQRQLRDLKAIFSEKIPEIKISIDGTDVDNLQIEILVKSIEAEYANELTHMKDESQNIYNAEIIFGHEDEHGNRHGGEYRMLREQQRQHLIKFKPNREPYKDCAVQGWRGFRGFLSGGKNFGKVATAVMVGVDSIKWAGDRVNGAISLIISKAVKATGGFFYGAYLTLREWRQHHRPANAPVYRLFHHVPVNPNSPSSMAHATELETFRAEIRAI